MTYSIYHFFLSLIHRKQHFKNLKKLEHFPFDKKLLSCKCQGVFPDLAIRINKDRELFTGGELIELKDSDSYTVSSFNSTIPSGRKEIEDIIKGENSTIGVQMRDAGDDILSLPERDVYYLVRGRKKGNTKVCLVHGSFFETIGIEDLINQSFSQVFEERLKESDIDIPEEYVKTFLSIFSKQANFSKVRNVEKASVKLRFRIMTEAKAEANILNSRKYPQITDNSLNFVLPYHDKNEEKEILSKAETVFSDVKDIKYFKIKHHFNGPFLVSQTGL